MGITLKLQERVLQKKLWVFLGVFFLFIFAILSALEIPIDAFPDITNTQVLINTKTGSLDPEQVEKTITYSIESEMAGLPRVVDLRSLSKFGLSQVVVVFEDGTDIYWARQLISEKLQGVNRKLPQGISPELGPISTGLGEVLMYVVLPKAGTPLAKKPEKERLLYLRTVHDFVIKPYLKAHVQGIAEIDATGGYQKEIHIDFHPQKLEAYGLTITQLLHTLKGVGENFGGGYIEREGQQIIVRTQGELNLEALKNIPVKLSIFGSPIRLRSIAAVRADHSPRVGAATYEGQQSVLGTVLMLLGANSRQVALAAKQALEKVEVPKDVRIQIVYSRTYLVGETIKTVAKNLSEGALLVILVLFLIMGNFRAAVIVALAIPLSMLGALIGMRQFGISANLMSLGAIDFGLLVDGSVVMIENLVRKLEDKDRASLSLAQKAKLVLESAKQVNPPIIMGLSIIMLVYIPILSLEGVEGKMFYPMAATVLMAIATSLVVAILLMPLLAYVFLSKPKLTKKPVVFAYIHKLYQPLVHFTLHTTNFWRFGILAFVGLLAALALLSFSRLGSDFMPPLNEGDMVINFTHPADISLSKTLDYQFKAEKEIRKFKEVKHVFSRIGTPESATDPMGVNLVDTFLILHDTAKWPRKKASGVRRSKSQVYRDLEKSLEPIMGTAEISENQPIAMRFNEILEGSRADVSLRIYGKDLNVLFQMQDKAVRILKQIPGAAEVSLDALTALKRSTVLELILDYRRLNAYNVHLNELNESFQTAMSGKEIGSYYEYDWKFPIILKMAEEYRNDYQAIGRIPISLPDPGSIRLSQVAQLQQRKDVVAIARANGRRYAGVAVYIADRDTNSFVNEAKRKLSQDLALKEGYELVWGGQFKNLERAKKRLLLIVPILLGLIFILLYQNLASLWKTFLIYLSIPFAALGGVFLLYLRDIHLSVSASIGFITLIGIATLNGMVLVSQITQLEEGGQATKAAVLEGALTRLRPVLMTALVAALGFLPMALNSGIGAEVQRPLATVVIGGLLSSTLLTLLVLPMLYDWIASRKKSLT